MRSTGVQLDSERILLREVDRSLKEWGRWSSDNIRTVCSGLDYPSEEPYAKIQGRMIEDFDMERVMEVEMAFTTWKMVTLQYTHSHQRKHNLLLLFILKIHYCETGAVPDKVHHTSRLFHRRLSRSTYYVLLKEARLKLATLLY